MFSVKTSLKALAAGTLLCKRGEDNINEHAEAKDAPTLPILSFFVNKKNKFDNNKSKIHISTDFFYMHMIFLLNILSAYFKLSQSNVRDRESCQIVIHLYEIIGF